MTLTTVRLGNVAGVRSGFAFKSTAWSQEGINVVKIANVKPGRLDFDRCSYVSEQLATRAGRFQLEVDDIVIAMTGVVGTVALVRSRDLPCVLNQRVGLFEVRDPALLDSYFLYCLLSTDEMQNNIRSLGYGSVQPNVSPELIESLTVQLPPVCYQREIAGVIRSLDRRSEAAENELDAIRSLRSTLFPRLLDGSIEIAAGNAFTR